MLCMQVVRPVPEREGDNWFEVRWYKRSSLSQRGVGDAVKSSFGHVTYPDDPEQSYFQIEPSTVVGLFDSLTRSNTIRSTDVKKLRIALSRSAVGAGNGWHNCWRCSEVKEEETRCCLTDGCGRWYHPSCVPVDCNECHPLCCPQNISPALDTP